MNTIEIRDEGIDTEEIMRKIRENIEKRRESSSEEMKDRTGEPQQTVEKEELGIDNIQQEIDYLNRYWDVDAEYSISSRDFSSEVSLLYSSVYSITKSNGSFLLS